MSSIAASRHSALHGDRSALPRTERDLPITTVALISLACFVPLAFLFTIFLHGTPVMSLGVPLVAAGVIYVVFAGFLVAAACGYMAGLIGASNSPVSGLGILSVIGAALLVLAVAKSAGVSGAPALVAYALFITAVLLNVATISNDNLQDLKTGQLVDATPWRQQVSLIAGVIFGSIVIPPILDLLNKAYGFSGGPHCALPAPQATLISALAKGVIEGQIRWDLIGTGALIGLGVIAVDEVLRARTRFQLPPLAVGLGIYLPAATTSAAVLGAVVGWIYNRWSRETAQPGRGPAHGRARRVGFHRRRKPLRRPARRRHRRQQQRQSVRRRRRCLRPHGGVAGRDFVRAGHLRPLPLERPPRAKHTRRLSGAPATPARDPRWP